MLSKDVEKVYKSIKQKKPRINEIVAIINRGINLKNIELVETMAAFVYNRIEDEHIKMRVSSILAKRGFIEFVPLNYIDKLGGIQKFSKKH